MLKMPYILYIDIKSNEQHQQEITGLTSLKVRGTSMVGLIMICLLSEMLHIKNISDEMASFVCLKKQPQFALTKLNMQTMCSTIFSGKTTRAYYCSL